FGFSVRVLPSCITATAGEEMTQMVTFVNDEVAAAAAGTTADILTAIEEVFSDHEIVTGVAVVVASGASFAQMAWLLRGSVVMTKLFSSMPVWAAFDPLPILSGRVGTTGLAHSDESLVDIANS
ncbi:hypothetical protein ACFL2H_10650, partial [Planctomycetota bacterium]